MNGKSLNNLAPEQEEQWLLSVATIRWLGDTGYLNHGHITIQGRNGWWAANVQRHSFGLEWFGPSRVSYEEDPGSAWLLELSLSAPVPFALLESMTWAFGDCELDVPNLLVRNGWGRTPITTSDVEVAIYATHSAEAGANAVGQFR